MTAALAPVRLEETLHAARLRNASDVHLSPNSRPVLRIDGALEVQETLVPSAAEIEAMTASLLDRPARERLETRGDVSTAYSDANIGRARIHAFRTASGTTLAIRLLAKGVPALESLHVPEIVASFAERPHGLVIFAGPTGSGKTTGLAALVDRINRTQSRHVITIEDPIEYEHVPNRSVISQRQVGTHVPDFAQGVLSALRSDPDVILLGEMRDAEAMHAALTAAETGHLVFTTLHTSDAAQTVERIISSFSGPAQDQVRIQLAQTLAAVVCTRLLPRLTAAGRRCAAEILVANDAVRTLIRDGKTHQIRNVIATSRQSGMQTLEAHLCELIALREIARDAAMLVTSRHGELQRTQTDSH